MNIVSFIGLFWKRDLYDFVHLRMQCTAARCNTLQRTAMHCNTLQLRRMGHDKIHSFRSCAKQNPSHITCHEKPMTYSKKTLQHIEIHCNALQHTATHYNALQRTATHCNSLQHCNATHCKTHWNPPQHTSSKEVGSTWGAANTMQHALQHNAILQNATATHCNTLHLTAAHLQQRSRKHSKRN